MSNFTAKSLWAFCIIIKFLMSQLFSTEAVFSTPDLGFKPIFSVFVAHYNGSSLCCQRLFTFQQFNDCPITLGTNIFILVRKIMPLRLSCDLSTPNFVMVHMIAVLRFGNQFYVLVLSHGGRMCF